MRRRLNHRAQARGCSVSACLLAAPARRAAVHAPAEGCLWTSRAGGLIRPGTQDVVRASCGYLARRPALGAAWSGTLDDLHGRLALRLALPVEETEQHFRVPRMVRARALPGDAIDL